MTIQYNKLRWVEAQEKKDQYKQMLLNEMRLLEMMIFRLSTQDPKISRKKRKILTATIKRLPTM